MSSGRLFIFGCRKLLFRCHKCCRLNDGVKLIRHSSNYPVNHEYDLDPDIKSRLDNKEFKHRFHPGLFKLPNEVLPEKLKQCMQILLERYPSRNLESEAEKLCKHLWSRHLPPDDEAIESHAEKLEKDVTEKLQNKNAIDVELSEEEQMQIQEKVKKKVITKLKQHFYHWQPVRYDAYKAFQYMYGRMSHDYTVLYKILMEISRRDPAFQPKTLLDFGSGVGTSLWAANAFWSQSLNEHVCVESAPDMSTLAQLLLQDGLEDREMCFNNVYFRQFMSYSNKRKFNLVLSAFSLMELPSQEERLKTVLNLWRKTEDFLVIVENGTNAGFKIISEVQQFIKELQEDDSIHSEEVVGHVFAPCPHDKPCPRVARNDGTPCNFDIQFEQFPANIKERGSHSKFRSRYSYVVLKKGRRDTEKVSWSRIVRPPTNPSRRANLQTCTAEGKLELSTLTPTRHGRDLYWCARYCKVGDLVPVIPRPEANKRKPRAKRNADQSGTREESRAQESDQSETRDGSRAQESDQSGTRDESHAQESDQSGMRDGSHAHDLDQSETRDGGHIDDVNQSEQSHDFDMDKHKVKSSTQL